MAIWYIAASLILIAIVLALVSVASLAFVFCFRHHNGPLACDYCKYIHSIFQNATFQVSFLSSLLLGKRHEVAGACLGKKAWSWWHTLHSIQIGSRMVSLLSNFHKWVGWFRHAYLIWLGTHAIHFFAGKKVIHKVQNGIPQVQVEIWMASRTKVFVVLSFHFENEKQHQLWCGIKNFFLANGEKTVDLRAHSGISFQAFEKFHYIFHIVTIIYLCCF